jgi:hypothetical protein
MSRNEKGGVVGIVRAFAAFTGWLTGELAGVGVIFYAIGYLITRAHLTFLGIYGLFDESYVQLITEGAMFALSIASFIGAVLLPLSAVFGVAALIVRLVLWLFGYFGLSDSVRDLTLPFLHWTHRPSFNAVLYVALLLLLLWHYDHYFESFQNPLLITNVLYDTSDSQNGGGPHNPTLRSPTLSDSNHIRLWLKQGDTEHTHDHFRALLWGEIFAALLLAAALHGMINWQWRLLWISYFAISFVVYTVSLPMVYGVLVDPIEYPVITLDSTDATLAQPSGKLFLLNKTDQDFVLWDSKGKRLLWIPKSEVRWAAVQQIENLFGSPAVRN